MKELRFFDPRDPATGFLSNFYRAPFFDSRQSVLDRHKWQTVEHCYQAYKFEDAQRVQQIADAPTPREAKRLGQLRDMPLRANWDEIKLWVMTNAIASKFVGGTFESFELITRLLDTDDVFIIEASPTDDYWGEGADGKGQNQLGRVLMALREVLPACDHENLQGLTGIGFTDVCEPDRFGNRDSGAYALRDRCIAAMWALLHDPKWDPRVVPPGFHVNVLRGPLVGQGCKEIREMLRPFMGAELSEPFNAGVGNRDQFGVDLLLVTFAGEHGALGWQFSTQTSRRFGWARRETLRVTPVPSHFEWNKPNEPPAAGAKPYQLVAAYAMKTPAQDDLLKRQYSQSACEAICLELVSGSSVQFISFFTKSDEGFDPQSRVDSALPPSPYGTPWELLLTTPERGAIPALEAAFAKRFEEWSIELPSALVVSRKACDDLQGASGGIAPWQIACVFGKDDRGEFVDYDGSHRHYGEGHERIYADGTLVMRNTPIEPALRFPWLGIDPHKLAKDKKWRDRWAWLKTRI